MRYEFPRIETLDEIRDIIKDLPEFIVAERDWGYVVNYLVMTPETFPGVHTAGGSARMREEASRAKAIRRECRGIAFDLNGKIISRPLHKFFNVNQTDETRANRIDLSQPHVILEKLDGSMIRPLPIGDGYRLATKMGITDVSMQAEVWLADHPNYDEFIRSCISSGVTPIFEWCSRSQKIVVDYPEDRLVLIAARNNVFGTYVGMYGLRGLAEAWNIDLVREYSNVNDIMRLLGDANTLTDQEGWVIRFDDGHMLKIKGDWYRARHNARDAICREKDTIAMILNDTLDDIKPVLNEDDRIRLEQFETDFWQGVNDTTGKWQLANSDVRSQFGSDRKGFAMNWAERFDPNLRGAIFKAWDNPCFDWRAAVIETIGKNLGSATKVDSVRDLFGGSRWTYGYNGGDE